MYVVKIGGGEGNDPANLVAGLRGLTPVVVIHGGSSAVDALGKRLGIPTTFLTSPGGFVSRHTDAAAIELVEMAMAGQTNVNLVASLQAAGVPAIGLCGIDGRLLTGERKAALRAVVDGRVKVVRDDRSGAVASVNTGLLRLLLDAGYVPVVSPPILDSAEGFPLNADADRVAAKIAAALGAEALVLLTNVPGFLREPQDPQSLVPSLPRRELDLAIASAAGGMKKKLLAAREALQGGVGRVVIADSRIPDPVRAALGGQGTVVA